MDADAGQPIVTVANVAAKALKSAKGDVLRATEIMVKRVRGNRKLYIAVLDPLLREACYAAVRGQQRAQRGGAIYHMPQPTSAETKSRVSALAVGTRNIYLNWPLPGGKRLGCANKEEVGAASDFYTKQALNMGSTGYWLELIRQRLPENTAVEEVFSNDELAELKQLAKTEIEPVSET